MADAVMKRNHREHVLSIPISLLLSCSALVSRWGFGVNCSALCLHNSAVLHLRRLGHQWPVTNGDEHVGDLLLSIEDAVASAERAKRTIP
jgi:hypothetical protein